MIQRIHLWEAGYEATYLEHFRVLESREPKPNPMFTALQHYVTRFIRPPNGDKWRCAACGKARGRAWFWTSTVPFHACHTASSFFLQPGPLLPGFTPVCSDHPMEIWPNEKDHEQPTT